MKIIDLITTSGLTASDGSIVASGATLKFDTEFMAASTMVRIQPRLYRNRELFDLGYEAIKMSEDVIPAAINLSFGLEDFYVLTPLKLYEEVGLSLNAFLGQDIFELSITEKNTD